MHDKIATENEPDTCEEQFVDAAKVNAVQTRMPDAESLNALSDIFKALGDPTRLRVVSALAIDELCVCDLANLLGSSISAVSHQLRVLRNMKLVKHRKDGKRVYYSLDDECVETLLAEGLKHIGE